MRKDKVIYQMGNIRIEHQTEKESNLDCYVISEFRSWDKTIVPMFYLSKAQIKKIIAKLEKEVSD